MRRGVGGSRRRAVVTSAVSAVVLTGVVVAVVAVSGAGGASAAADGAADEGGSDGQTATAVDAGATATVVRTDLVRTETLSGSLTFGETRALTSARDGVVTTAPEAGAEIPVGSVLYAVDAEPTVLLTGTVPSYRELSQDSSDGLDISQLEQALVDAGHGDAVSVDGDFDGATADAVEAWEEALGRSDPDGVVALGDVVFATAAVRVSAVPAPVGAAVRQGDTVLEASGTTRRVDLDADVDRADDLAAGTVVTVELPDGSQAPGTVAEVGTVAEENPSDPEAGATVPVVVSFDDVAAAAGFSSGTVDVVVERSREEDVLAVPVTALLALAEGGYAVEVVDTAGATRLVAVEIGTFTDDLVAVTGAGDEPAEGTEVVVAG